MFCTESQYCPIFMWLVYYQFCLYWIIITTFFISWYFVELIDIAEMWFCYRDIFVTCVGDCITASWLLSDHTCNTTGAAGGIEHASEAPNFDPFIVGLASALVFCVTSCSSYLQLNIDCILFDSLPCVFWSSWFPAIMFRPCKWICPIFHASVFVCRYLHCIKRLCLNPTNY